MRLFPLIAMIAALCLGACASSTEGDTCYSQFVQLPSEGWRRDAPCYFHAGDSLGACNVYVALRHDSQYRFAHVNLTVDIVNADTVTRRQPVRIKLADGNGNWVSEGFGSLYQCQVPVYEGVSIDSTTTVLVWQTMNDSTQLLRNVQEVGIEITKLNQQ